MWSNVSHLRLIFILSLVVSGIFMCPTIMVFLSVSPFGPLVVALYLLAHLNLINLIVHLCVVFFISFDVSVAALTDLWMLFAWSIILQPFTLSLCLSLKQRGVSCSQHIFWSCWIHATTLCLLMGEFSPFAWRVIVDEDSLQLFYLLFSGCSVSPLFLFASDCHFSLAFLGQRQVSWW